MSCKASRQSPSEVTSKITLSWPGMSGRPLNRHVSGHEVGEDTCKFVFFTEKEKRRFPFTGSVCSTIHFIFWGWNPTVRTPAARHCTYVVWGPNNCVHAYMRMCSIQDLNDRRIQCSNQSKNTWKIHQYNLHFLHFLHSRDVFEAWWETGWEFLHKVDTRVLKGVIMKPLHRMVETQARQKKSCRSDSCRPVWEDSCGVFMKSGWESNTVVCGVIEEGKDTERVKIWLACLKAAVWTIPLRWKGCTKERALAVLSNNWNHIKKMLLWK